jgi:hypothetical protein
MYPKNNNSILYYLGRHIITLKKFILIIILIIILISTIYSLFVRNISKENLAFSIPTTPTDFTAITISGTRIDLIWTKGDNADTTYIERNVVSYWSRGEGTLIYNDTGNNLQDKEIYQTNNYYQAWSWNRTDNVFSTNYTTAYNTTFANQPPFFTFPRPVNGSINNPLNLSWNIQINDPDGDVFSWAIQCSNGQNNSGVGATNGIKSLDLNGLTNSTTYKVWVNATDPTGSGLYTRKWYNFSTENLQPNKPNKPLGQIKGEIDIEYTYTSNTTDPEGDKVYYQWDWGDGNVSEWLGPYNSGITCEAKHTWNIKGTYDIKVKAKDIYGKESSWSDPLSISIPKTKIVIKTFLQIFLHNHPNLFLFLQKLLNHFGQ